MKLTNGQIQMLREPRSLGYCRGSNMWPFLAFYNDDGDEVCSGEEIDELLRAGLIEATPLGEPVFVEAGGADIPDNECTHQIDITPAGRAALSEGGKP